MKPNDVIPDDYEIPPQYGVSTVASRSYLSSHHLWSARHFISLAKRIEDEHEGGPTFNLEHRGHVLGAILCGVGFFDAAVNEIYQDANDCHGGYIDPLGWVAICKLGRKWRDSSRCMLLMEKYQEALVCIGHDQFDAGRAPYQDAKLAVNLRNALVHYTPETVSADEKSKFEVELKSKLKGKKYPLNKLMNGSRGNPFFPDHCLGYGCATWVLDSLLAFTEAFFQRIGITPNYQNVLPTTLVFKV